MNATPAELAARLRAEGESVQFFFQGLAEAAWGQTIYTEGDAWQVREILTHFIAAELGFQDLIQNVASGGSGVEENFDIDAYNARTLRDMRGHDTPVLIGQFAMARERTAAIVAALHPDQLDHIGRHPFLGVTTLSEMVRAIYHHNSLHLRDVRRALRSAGSGRLSHSGVVG